MKQISGFAVITTLMVCVVLAVLLTAFFFTTSAELNSNRVSSQSASSFYAAEAGLNIRGDEIRRVFLNDNNPTGTSPNTTNPCQGTNNGTGDFQCKSFTVNNQTVKTYMIDDPTNATGGRNITIPINEPYGGLSAIESRYSVLSRADTNDSSALLEIIFRSRVVPLFQFAAFYNKDLEILPGANMTLNGRVHTNGNLYLNSDATLEVTGQITVAKESTRTAGGSLYRGRKNTNACAGTVRADDAKSSTSPNPVLSCASGRKKYTEADLTTWNGQIRTGLDYVSVPSAGKFEPKGEYWEKADLRIVLDLTKNPAELIVPQATVSVAGTGTSTTYTYTKDVTKTTKLDGCAAVSFSNGAMRNTREEENMQLLDVNVQALMNCLHNNKATFFTNGVGIDESSHMGLVWYLTVNGPKSSQVNKYGVRLKNGATLGSNVVGAPAIKGLTVVTDQAAYVQGDYNLNTTAANANNWKPASILADSFNMLSNSWNDANSNSGLGSRVASNTEINAALLAGTDTTGNYDSEVGQDKGDYNGGLENFPRLHEDWSGKTLTYRGSFVSLNTPLHVDGEWATTSYKAALRNWSYDTRFNDAAKLPPLSPKFVYLVQELFVRDFEQ
jgi:Tfp pilus assembly protein PilX